MSKIILKNGRILDGTGNPWFIGDIAIENKIISKIEKRRNINPSSKDKVIEADGKIVCPGFIDIHAHSDASFFKDKYASSKICQGVTTEVVGNCGMSCAPTFGEGGDKFLEMNNRFFGNLQVNLESMENYMNELEKNGIPLNIAPLVGHSTIRATTMGYKLKKPSKDEQQTMEKLLEESLAAGAFGMSLGYQPGEQADLDELVSLARVVANYDGFIASHPAQLSLKKWEDEGGDSHSELTKNIQQLLDIGEQARVPVQISHVKAIGSAGWGRAGWIVDLINRARTRGIDVTCDLYGYPVGGGSIRGIFAPKFLSYDCKKDIPSVISEAIQDKRIKEKALEQIEFTIHALGGTNRVKILNSPSDHSADKKTLQTLSQERMMKPSEVVLDFLQKEDATLLCTWGMEKDVITLIKHPTAMICSDGYSISLEDALNEGSIHPRNFGAFPRIIKFYVKELGVLTLEDAIRKMTTLPADRLGLKDRGKIQEGNYADLVVFDYEEIDDMATYENPCQFPNGIEYVFVNGEIAVEKGKYKKTLSGHVLRKVN